MSDKEKLIVALDVASAQEAFALVETLGDTVSFYKVGMQLYFSAGNAFIQELRKRNKRVFLDLKINDIPETIALAVEQIIRLEVDYLTLFTGAKQIETACARVREKKSALKLLSVTVLTSEESHFEEVERRARLSLEAGADGLICSGKETARLRTLFGASAILVNPGIRPQGSAQDDQVRVVTPFDALRGGATNIVVGRPITKAQNPVDAAKAILCEIQKAIESL